MFNPAYSQFISYKPKMTVPEGAQALRHFCASNALAGTELFLDDFVPRNSPLFSNAAEKQALIAQLLAHGVKRLHAAYWAWPTAFLTKNGWDALFQRFGGADAVRAYYGDLTGAHLYARWVDEYALGAALGVEAYSFHLIDYAPIDGLWSFTQTREEICSAMAELLQCFIDRLDASGLLGPDAPVIEIENAGWGLEYGIQTAEDFAELFLKLDDPHGKVRIGWDINHLLHAIGVDTASGTARFFLPEAEITDSMRALEKSLGTDPQAFAQAWVAQNLLAPATANKVISVHLSDCALKTTAYFRRGRLEEPYASQIDALADMDAKEAYGVELVLRHYDSHLPLGRGVLSGRALRQTLEALAAQNTGFALLHELKNAHDLPRDYKIQRDALDEV